MFLFFSLEIKVTVDVEKNESQSQEIRTLAKFELSVKNIILELFKEGPDKVIDKLILIILKNFKTK